MPHSLIPLFGILWAVLFLHEPVTLGLFAGLGVILTSVWLVLEKSGARPPATSANDRVPHYY
jgi:drug/metabolite transporter (DMT)-like permease